MGLLDSLFGGKGKKFAEHCVMGEESIMSPKSHGTCYCHYQLFPPRNVIYVYITLINNNAFRLLFDLGTSNTPVQENLRWGCDQKVADNICNFNRHYAG